MRSPLTAHWPLAILAAIALPLIFLGLGRECLWEDEGDTAVLASSIVKFGVPKAWDGVTFSDSDRGARVNDAMVMVSHPWLQYYAAAAAFALFGESSFTARLPFAIAGWLTLLMLYALVWRMTGNRLAAFSSAALLFLNVQFLLYCRQSRYYTLTMLITCALFWLLFELNSERAAAFFVALAVLLFHTQPIAVVPVIAIGALTLFYPPLRKHRRWFWMTIPIILFLTAPWFLLATRGYGEGAQLTGNAAQFAVRFVQALIESASVTPLIGVLLLLLARPKLSSREKTFLMIALASVLLHSFVLALTQSTNVLWYHGARYETGLLPIVAGCAGILIASLSRSRVEIALPVLLIFAFTKFAQPAPWFSWSSDGRLPLGRYVVAVHLPQRLSDRFAGAGHAAYMRDLWTANPGTIANAVAFLQPYARHNDVLLSNYGWEPLYFHTRLAQARKILPDYRIKPAAERRGLPEYVFGVDHAQWIFWRPYWDGYLGFRWADVEREIAANGGRLTAVRELEETIWENRENIHFHRFAGVVYLFEPPAETIAGGNATVAPAEILRVDW